MRLTGFMIGEQPGDWQCLGFAVVVFFPFCQRLSWHPCLIASALPRRRKATSHSDRLGFSALGHMKVQCWSDPGKQRVCGRGQQGGVSGRGARHRTPAPAGGGAVAHPPRGSRWGRGFPRGSCTSGIGVSRRSGPRGARTPDPLGVNEVL